MARPIVLSNGELHIGLNKYGLVHDFYFPYVGLENHSAGKALRHRVGVWVDGQLSWLDSGAWELSFRYPHNALIGQTTAKNDALGLILEFDDFVDAQYNAFVRNIHVVNTRDREREVRVFMHQAFAIGDSRSNTDTAQYLPDSDSILHYRGRRAFVISGNNSGQAFDQHAIGIFGIEGREGTYRDAEDGELSNGNVEHGRVDSTVRFVVNVGANSSERFQYWIAAGTSIRRALLVHKQLQDEGATRRLERTAAHWHQWLRPALKISEKVDKKYRQNFINSLLIIKSQIDKRGAVLASTDTTMLNYSRDAYGYCWPRDGAFVLWPLIRMGYKEELLQFFRFCKDVLNPSKGYLMHKYQADGALGSSWHPYVHDGILAPPIQEDETALVVFVFAQFYAMHQNPSYLDQFYDAMIFPMANFMAEYIDQATGLPKPSYDLWEENFLTTTYTTSVTYAALVAAADLAEARKDSDSCVKWRAAADDILQAAHRHLYNPDRKSFYKGVILKNGHLQKDETIDASAVFGAFMFGLFPGEGDEIQSAIATIEERFGLNDPTVKGIPRYENDNYYRTETSGLGNPWFITTMWMAQYYNEKGQSEKATKILDWVNGAALETGVLSEQVHPGSQEFLSVAPLTWTHAEFLSTLLDVISEPRE